MVHIFSEEGQKAITCVAESRALLAFDFDGTLAPIVVDRDAAALSLETRHLLRTTALLYPCAVVSGRSRADVAARVTGIPLVAVVGNHGAEAGFGPLDSALRERVASWRQMVRHQLSGVVGIEIEDKGYSIALHYRRALEPRQAEQRIEAAIASLRGVVAFRGQAVINVLPSEAPNKSDALRALCKRFKLRLAVYVGDDRTDEEVFRSGAVEVGVRVGEHPGSAAGYSLASQVEVDDLLRALVSARVRADGFTGSCEGVLQALKR
jgi:trehalose 6-phosphate phosphatase